MVSVVMGVVVYISLLAFTRITGRRTLAQTTVFDMVLLLILAETTQNVLLRDDWSVTNFIVVLSTIGIIDVALSYLKLHFPRLEQWIEGAPSLLMQNGRLDEEAMRRSRVDRVDLLEAARTQHGLGSLEGVDAAVLETGGGISIMPIRRQGGDDQAPG